MTTSPQIKNGYTRIANEILEALTLIKLTSQETKAILLIIRNTYGFQRKVWHVDRWTFFEDIGIHRANIKATLTKLANRQIIKLKWHKKLISFQKDYTLWDKKVSQPANLLDADIEEEVSQPTNSTETEVSQPTNKNLVNQLEKVSQMTCFTPPKANKDNNPQEPKESKENKESKYIYSEQARGLRNIIAVRYGIADPLSNKEIPTLQFMIDLLKLHDCAYIEGKISELPAVIEHKEIGRTLRYWCEHPEKSKSVDNITPTPYKQHTLEAHFKKVEENRAMWAKVGVIK